MTLTHQLGNINKEIQGVRKESNGNTGVENITTEMKCSLAGLNGRFEVEEERSSKLEYKTMEIIKNRKKKE